MILLPEKDYGKVISALHTVAINNLFARAVVEHKVAGMVYADKMEQPSTFYVVHPYNISLLLGNTGNTEFNEAFKEYALNKNRQKYEWMQAASLEWHNVLARLFENQLIEVAENDGNPSPGKIEVNTRVNFKFNKHEYLKRRNTFITSHPVQRTSAETFANMPGAVIPRSFWNTATDFLNTGLGFSILYENKIVSTAFSAFVFDNKLEIGIETDANYQGKGFAIQACVALIDYCIQHDLEPVWSCRMENTGSYLLAQKLGFEPTVFIPFYRLPTS